MGRAFNKLTAVRVKTTTGKGKLYDGGGLMLLVDASGQKRWVLRITAGKRQDLGLGGYPAVSLEEARKKAQAARERALRGDDPSPTAALRVAQAERVVVTDRPTFREAFTSYFETKRRSLSNGKHIKQWTSTMEAYAFPVFGERPVADITAAEVISALQPVWFDKPETGKRVLQRIKNTFDFAIVTGLRDKASPCVGVEKMLGTRHRDVKHHRALPWRDVPAFMKALRSGSADDKGRLTRLLLEFSILTAARSGEARGARHDEISLSEQCWTIPGNNEETGRRMKGGEEHTVPLTPRALKIVEEARSLAPDSDLIFPSSRGGPVSDMTLTALVRRMGYAEVATVHGFRSSFKDWCAETGVADDVSEAALAHQDRNKVRSAYKRTSFLDQRKALMMTWATFCASVD